MKCYELLISFQCHLKMIHVVSLLRAFRFNTRHEHPSSFVNSLAYVLLVQVMLDMPISDSRILWNLEEKFTRLVWFVTILCKTLYKSLEYFVFEQLFPSLPTEKFNFDTIIYCLRPKVTSIYTHNLTYKTRFYLKQCNELVVHLVQSFVLRIHQDTCLHFMSAYLSLAKARLLRETWFNQTQHTNSSLLS